VILTPSWKSQFILNNIITKVFTKDKVVLIIIYRIIVLFGVVVGNKCDREDSRAVPAVDGQILADQMNIPFLETSAKDNLNIEQVEL